MSSPVEHPPLTPPPAGQAAMQRKNSPGSGSWYQICKAQRDLSVLRAQAMLRENPDSVFKALEAVGELKQSKAIKKKPHPDSVIDKLDSGCQL